MIQYQCTSDFSEVVLSCRCAFSKRSWPYMTAMVVPWLLATGQRHVRRLCTGVSWERHESSYYRFLSRFKFRRELFFRALFELIVRTFRPTELLIVADDTLCPKWGKHIHGTASFFDHVRRPRPGYIWGHNWVILAVVVQLFGVPVALPFWVELYRSQGSCSKEDFRTRLDMVAKALSGVQHWTALPMSLVADGAYNNRSILRPLAALKIPVVSRLRFDASLRRDPPKRRRKTRGRKPKYGAWLPKLRNLARTAGGWKTEQVQIYGKCVALRVKTFDAWWPKAGVKLRIVITRDPSGRRKPCYLSSTDLSMTPVAIIERFALRWSIEQMFSDAKLLMGLDSAEVRTENSVLRHAILTFAHVTWVRVWAQRSLAEDLQPPTSFAGQLNQLREDLMTETILRSIPGRKLSKRNSEDLARLAVA